MAQSLSDQRETGGVTQRQVLAAARTFASFVNDPSLIVADPIGYARAEAALVLIFERCAKERIFSGYVKHNLAFGAYKSLESRYLEWERQERLAVEA